MRTLAAHVQQVEQLQRRLTQAVGIVERHGEDSVAEAVEALAPEAVAGDAEDGEGVGDDALDLLGFDQQFLGPLGRRGEGAGVAVDIDPGGGWCGLRDRHCPVALVGVVDIDPVRELRRGPGQHDLAVREERDRDEAVGGCEGGGLAAMLEKRRISAVTGPVLWGSWGSVHSIRLWFENVLNWGVAMRLGG